MPKMVFGTVIIQPTAPHTHTIIFLHGRGSSALNLADHIQNNGGDAYTGSLCSLSEALPSVRWVFPQAQVRDVAAHPPQRWRQWFDVWNVRDFNDHEGLQAEGLRESVDTIRAIAGHEAALLGGRWERVVLAGLSQGGSTVVHTLLNIDVDGELGPAPQGYPPGAATEVKTQNGVGEAAGASTANANDAATRCQPAATTNNSTATASVTASATASASAGRRTGPRRLGAVLTFASRMPFPGGTIAETREVLSLPRVPEDDEVVRNTPILVEHCRDDPQILVGLGRDLRDQLVSWGADVTWKEYYQGGHGFNSPHGMDDVVKFLNRVLGL